MKIGNLEITIGADPEVFVTKEGRLVSAHGLVQGTKEDPFKVKDGAVQVDGMALEFNIDPAKDLDSFLNNLDSVMSQLSDMCPEHELNPIPVAEFGKQVMDETPEFAKELGCDPDFNAWDGGAENPRPDGEVDFRTGAGHIHIGWTEGMDVLDPAHVDACIALVRQLDAYLGVPSVVLDDCDKRRELYGKAGAFRVKPYGVEYRVLSNFWLKSPELKSWVYNQVILCVKNMIAGILVADRACVNIINNNYHERAKTFLRNHGIKTPLPELKPPSPNNLEKLFGASNVQRA